MIFEKGKCLAESKPFEYKDLITEVDIDYLEGKKQNLQKLESGYDTVYFESKIEKTAITRQPFFY